LRITDAAGTLVVDFPVNNSDYSRPSWSPDGRQLIYTHDVRFDDLNPEVFVASVDASVLTNVSNSPEYEGEVAWSPTGSEVALFAVRGDDSGIFTMQPDGTGLTLRYRGIQVVGYRWSPDGSRLLFTEYGPQNFEARLIVMRADGSVPTIVAEGSLQGLSPAWSPDGEWIAFSMLGPNDEYDVYVVRPDGSGLRNLTESSGHGRWPIWIPRE
jgi:TolB protein